MLGIDKFNYYRCSLLSWTLNVTSLLLATRSPISGGFHMFELLKGALHQLTELSICQLIEDHTENRRARASQ